MGWVQVGGGGTCRSAVVASRHGRAGPLGIFPFHMGTSRRRSSEHSPARREPDFRVRDSLFLFINQDKGHGYSQGGTHRACRPGLMEDIGDGQDHR